MIRWWMRIRSGYEQELVIYEKDAKKNLEHKWKSRVKRGNTVKEINTWLCASAIHRSQETTSEDM